MDVLIRQEQPKDFNEVEQVVQESFRKVQTSDHQEQLRIGKLRATCAYVPELALVAENEETGDLIGFSLMTEAVIGGSPIPALAMGPVSVLPDYQNKGIGMMLIEEGIRRAKVNGYLAITTFGDPDFYSRIGFKNALDHGIQPPEQSGEGQYLILDLREERIRGPGRQHPAGKDD
ncbi:GNAT family N-acetyltransferase [Edaphobacillus lindanitolerans]|uniref:Predicted N-acetyltransferase YhbS n=1 Tax=Edaphobacillus lindanitolerans TaxID=550447 RepID=A0A1U7PL72_9BACI|nr:N-acetyltransferase [Edaphobacillus lindanitolerans]SIT79629.1 Predicted N-acetyltransferase YhbS [Edaphobacillus lindanitolerans]